MPSITGFVTIRNALISIDGQPAGYAKKTSTLEDCLQQAYEALNLSYPKFYKMDRLSAAGLIASEILLGKYPIKNVPAAQKAVVLANASGSLDTDLRYENASRTAPSPALFVYTLPNIVTGEICIRHGIKGENAFFISEHFDAGMMVTYVDQVLSVPHTRVCLAGWIEVLEGHHDVLVYLVENESRGMDIPHTTEQLNNLYHH